VAVAATDQQDHRASFSNFGAHIDVSGPGVGIRSTDWDNTNSDKSGTSMATPHVAGVAALVKSVGPGLTSAQIADILRNTARPLRDNPADPVPNDRYGHGLVNAAAAVRAAAPPPPCRPCRPPCLPPPPCRPCRPCLPPPPCLPCRPCLPPPPCRPCLPPPPCLPCRPCLPPPCLPCRPCLPPPPCRPCVPPPPCRPCVPCVPPPPCIVGPGESQGSESDPAGGFGPGGWAQPAAGGGYEEPVSGEQSAPVTPRETQGAASGGTDDDDAKGATARRTTRRRK
jgi:hypothetical protein